jgi:hypothetical protein
MLGFGLELAIFRLAGSELLRLYLVSARQVRVHLVSAQQAGRCALRFGATRAAVGAICISKSY